jgi:hypothetical protein
MRSAFGRSILPILRFDPQPAFVFGMALVVVFVDPDKKIRNA